MTTIPKTYAEFEALYLANLEKIAEQNSAAVRIAARIQAAGDYALRLETVCRPAGLDISEATIGVQQAIFGLLRGLGKGIPDANTRTFAVIDILSVVMTAMLDELHNASKPEAESLLDAEPAGRA